MTPSIDQTLHLFANLLPNWTLIPILTLLPNLRGFHRTLQQVRLANRGRLLLRTPGPVPFGTCICSNVEAILSWTCLIYGTFEFQTSLGTFILLGRGCCIRLKCCREEVKNNLANQRSGDNLGFPIGLKKTNWLEDVEIWLHFKFHWIQIGVFREEVKNVKR